MAMPARRRWGYFPMLHRLRATSAKQRRPTVPALSLEAQARRSADDIPAAAADMSAGTLFGDSVLCQAKQAVLGMKVVLALPCTHRN